MEKVLDQQPEAALAMARFLDACSDASKVSHVLGISTHPSILQAPRISDGRIGHRLVGRVVYRQDLCNARVCT